MANGGEIMIAAKLRQVQTGEITELKAGKYICLSVKDEGEGMDAETVEASVTPFFTTKGVGKGTGLGLPMVQGLMAQSGGKLVIKSEKGLGTTAELWIPVADQAHSEMVEAASELMPHEVRQLTVLAVDDDPLVMMNTILMLEDLGHRVVDAQSADEALRILASRPEIELIITDHSMPRMTGAQLASEVSRLRPDIRIVLATGYAELPNDEGAALLRLTKPFTQDQLAAAIAKVLS
jgi:CheY-like chemotaxis protein